MPSEETNRATRREWRELGFFYDLDNAAKEWRLTGDRAGLLRFAEILERYAANPKNSLKSEHEHYGPYMYLKVMTWETAGIDETSIHGPLKDLARLSELVRAAVGGAEPCIKIRIREEYSAESEYALVLAIKEDGFDPAAADPQSAGGDQSSDPAR